MSMLASMLEPVELNILSIDGSSKRIMSLARLRLKGGA